MRYSLNAANWYQYHKFLLRQLFVTSTITVGGELRQVNLLQSDYLNLYQR